MRRGSSFAPRVLADDVFVIELDSTFLDFVEQKFQRHQLSQACRSHQLIAILFVQNAVAVGIEENGGGNARLKALIFLSGSSRCGWCGIGSRKAAERDRDRSNGD